MHRLLPLALCATIVAGCAAPSPTQVGGRPAQLDPGAALYDTVAFETGRDLPFTGEQVCEQLDSTQPFDESSGCGFDLPDGSFGTFKLEVNEFRLFWLGAVSKYYRGFDHSERGVLLGRYYSVQFVDAAYLTRPCTVAVDVGGPQALTVTATPSTEVSEGLDDGTALPLADSLDLCAEATSAAEQILTTMDPDGGSTTS